MTHWRSNGSKQNKTSAEPGVQCDNPILPYKNCEDELTYSSQDFMAQK